MFGMMGFPKDWIELVKEAEEPVHEDQRVEVDDIVEIAVRDMKPVFLTSTRYDDLAQLRVLGEAQGTNRLYIMLVTDGDAQKVSPTTTVGRVHMSDYGVDPRFYGCDAIISSELHVRRVVKKQNGRFCDVCTDYNKDVRMPKSETYVCSACRQNPYR